MARESPSNVGPVSFVLLYVVITSEVISGWVLYSVVPMGHQAASNITLYPIQTQYPDTEPTSLWPILQVSIVSHWFDLTRVCEREFVLFNDASRAHRISNRRLLYINHMFLFKYFSSRNLLTPHMLLFPISRKGSCICTFPKIGQHIPQPLMDQLLTTGGNGN